MRVRLGDDLPRAVELHDDGRRVAWSITLMVPSHGTGSRFECHERASSVAPDVRDHEAVDHQR